MDSRKPLTHIVHYSWQTASNAVVIVIKKKCCNPFKDVVEETTVLSRRLRNLGAYFPLHPGKKHKGEFELSIFFI